MKRARGPEGPRVEPREEHGDLCAGRGDAIAVAARDPLDEVVQAQTSEVVGHGSGGVGVGRSTLELRDVIAELAMSKARGREREETERVHERMDARIAEAQAGGPLVLDEDG